MKTALFTTAGGAREKVIIGRVERSVVVGKVELMALPSDHHEVHACGV